MFVVFCNYITMHGFVNVILDDLTTVCYIFRLLYTGMWQTALR